eukprot:gene24340-biopygen16414
MRGCLIRRFRQPRAKDRENAHEDIVVGKLDYSLPESIRSLARPERARVAVRIAIRKQEAPAAPAPARYEQRHPATPASRPRHTQSLLWRHIPPCQRINFHHTGGNVMMNGESFSKHPVAEFLGAPSNPVLQPDQCVCPFSPKVFPPQRGPLRGAGTGCPGKVKIAF